MAGLLEKISTEKFLVIFVLGFILFIAILCQILLVNTVETWFTRSTEILLRITVILIGIFSVLILRFLFIRLVEGTWFGMYPFVVLINRERWILY